MKKLFVMTLAVAALASCSKVETIEPGYKSAIGFSKSFVDNSTKALIEDEDDLKNENFAVWGSEQQEGQAAVSIFDAEEITWNTTESAWEYDSQARYWHKDHQFKFAAVAPFSANTNVTEENFLPKTATYTLKDALADQVDLLYAAMDVKPTTDDYATPVAFTFSHMLAKVDFKVINSYSADYTVVIDDLKITAAKDATVTFATANAQWKDHDNTVEIPFTVDEVPAANNKLSNEQSLIIPKATTDPDYIVDGTATVMMNGTTPIKVYDLDFELDGEFLAGYHYTLVATIEPTKPIKFDVEKVNGFENGANTNIN
ncbi:MAG: fimbrillin family protein [Tidjanibacter sp.]|nr:fimbrillin family protein [Tidjanibacter sp.]